MRELNHGWLEVSLAPLALPRCVRTAIAIGSCRAEPGRLVRVPAGTTQVMIELELSLESLWAVGRLELEVWVEAGHRTRVSVPSPGFSSVVRRLASTAGL